LPDVATIQATIRERLVELEEQIASLRVEAQQLSAILDVYPDPSTDARRARNAPSLDRTEPASKTSRNQPRATAGAPSAKRGRPVGSGTRAKEALATIGERPGITASELATSMGIGPSYLYRVLPRLEQEGTLIKRGTGYYLAGEPAAPIAAPAARDPLGLVVPEEKHGPPS
jgi:hypothetical protein